MGRIILPNNYVETDRLIFLAGPIRSAPKWQDKAIEILFDIDDDLNIASPSWSLREYLTANNPKRLGESQIPWETHYLREAGLEKGSILFWLSDCEKHDCEYGYGRTTRFELGEWLTKSELLGAYVALGIDYNFEGKNYIRKRISEGFHLPVFNTLEETCREAIRLVERRQINNSNEDYG